MDDKKLYAVIYGMRKRCYDENSKDYKHYGGRGITICDRWLGEGGTRNFVSDMSPLYQSGLTIERIDVNGNYEPKNCSWVTQREQCNNRTSNRYLTFQGKTMTMAMWAEEAGLKYKTLAQRINGYHWSIDKALSVPLMKKGV